MISPFPTQAQAPVVKTPGVMGQQGVNLKGAVPTVAAPQPRASQMPIRPVPKATTGGPTGGGFGIDQSKPSGGSKGLGEELAKAQAAANKATQGDLDNAIGALNGAEAAIGREANALRSALYADAKASVEIQRREAVEGAAQMGIALNPFLMEGVMQRADTVAMAQYRRGAAEIRQQVAQERMVLAQSKASLYGSITRQGIDPALAARIAESTGAGRAARDATGRLLSESEKQNKAYLDALKQLQAEMGITGTAPSGAAPRPGRPGLPGAPVPPSSGGAPPVLPGQPTAPSTMPKAATPKAAPAYDPVGFTHVKDPQMREDLLRAKQRAVNNGADRAQKFDADLNEAMKQGEEAAKLWLASRKALDELEEGRKWFEDYKAKKAQETTGSPAYKDAQAGKASPGTGGENAALRVMLDDPGFQKHLQSLSRDARAKVEKAIRDNPMMSTNELQAIIIQAIEQQTQIEEAFANRLKGGGR